MCSKYVTPRGLVLLHRVMNSSIMILDKKATTFQVNETAVGDRQRHLPKDPPHSWKLSSSTKEATSFAW